MQYVRTTIFYFCFFIFYFLRGWRAFSLNPLLASSASRYYVACLYSSAINEPHDIPSGLISIDEEQAVRVTSTASTYALPSARKIWVCSTT